MYLLALLFQMMDMPEHAGHAMNMPDPVSIFDHHMAGWIILLLGTFVFLEQTQLSSRYTWVKFLWPLTLLGLATFLIVWRDREVWADWHLHGMLVQHKIFEAAAILMALIELFRRAGRLKHPAWRQLLNVLIIGAGVFLIFHGRGQHAPMIDMQHMWMGTVVLAIGLTKMVADLSWGGRLLAYAVPTLFIILGLQFALYVE